MELLVLIFTTLSCFLAYGKRMMKICEFAGIEYDHNISPEYLPVPLDVVEGFLRKKDKHYK